LNALEQIKNTDSLVAVTTNHSRFSAKKMLNPIPFPVNGIYFLSYFTHQSKPTPLLLTAQAYQLAP
jgi:hypothetical protein